MAHNDVARRTSATPARTVTRAAACDEAAPRETVRLLTRDLPGRPLVRPLPLRSLSRAERDAV
ncbi:hypothetical protein GCM10009759_00210 [Kitasatospora saccharophila]|uniref:Uncharacterized protein n=1 Tax=Kitasatospora saccharophila TaxID=407973 RepID=A0ABN2W3L7_9ACTN